MNILAMPNRVLVKVPMDLKEFYQLADDVKLFWPRWINNFDGREDNPVNGVVVNGEGLEEGVEVLLEHNATHESNEIFDSDYPLEPNFKLFSVAVTEVLLWRYKYDKEDKLKGWQLYRNVMIVSNLFIHRKSIIILEPEQIKNRVFVLRGQYENKALIVAKAVAYTIVYQEANGRDAQITIMKDTESIDVPVILGVDEGLTEKVLCGEVSMAKEFPGEEKNRNVLCEKI